MSENELLTAIEQAWDCGGKPEMFYSFIQQEWRLFKTDDGGQTWYEVEPGHA